MQAAAQPATQSTVCRCRLSHCCCSAWADHFDSIGADYVFWSAKAGMDELSAGEYVVQPC